MAKKRTRKQKEHAQKVHVNSQIGYEFKPTYNSEAKNKMANMSAKKDDLGSIKKELFKSLFLAILILTGLMVVYWVS